MGTLNSFLEAVALGVADIVRDQCHDVETHPGRFTENEIVKASLSKRAIRIAIADIIEIGITPNRGTDYTVQVAAFVVCADQFGPDRDESARDILELIVSALPFQRWNSDACQPVLPATVSAQNIYSTESESKGVSMWAVSWDQKIRSNTKR